MAAENMPSGNAAIRSLASPSKLLIVGDVKSSCEPGFCRATASTSGSSSSVYTYSITDALE